MEKHFLLGAHPFWNINVHELFTNWPWIDCLNTNCSGIVQEQQATSLQCQPGGLYAREDGEAALRKDKTTGRKDNKTGVKLCAPVPHTSKACRTGAEQVLNKHWTSIEQVLNKHWTSIEQALNKRWTSAEQGADKCSPLYPGHQSFRVRRQFRAGQ